MLLGDATRPNARCSRSPLHFLMRSVGSERDFPTKWPGPQFSQIRRCQIDFPPATRGPLRSEDRATPWEGRKCGSQPLSLWSGDHGKAMHSVGMCSIWLPVICHTMSSPVQYWVPILYCTVLQVRLSASLER